MRRIALIVVGVLAIAATAAFAVTNTYRVGGTISPTSAGTAKRPVPVAVNFNYKIGELNNQRPSPVKQYKINFAGLQVNTSPFKACTAQRINAETTDANCPSGSKMGTGNIQATVGATSDPSAQSLHCYLALTFYNSGKNHAALYLKGTAGAADPSKSCITDISQAIDASFIRSSKGTTLQFTVPPSLLHPVGGLDVAVTNVTSKIVRKTAKVKGKTRGFFQSVGGCTKSKRAITVTFVSESGQNSRAQGFAKCKK